jgi:hypothetical protein
MGMYTELNISVEIAPCDEVIQKLRYMLGELDIDEVEMSHPLFQTERWDYMLCSDSYYFDMQTDSKLYRDDLYVNDPMYFLNVRCNLKNYCNEIELFLDWLCPYILTEGYIGYKRYEESYDPTLIYKENGEIKYKTV